MGIPFLLGLAGSVLLVIGAAVPDRSVRHAIQSPKNWLFAVGGLVMFLYALANVLAGGPVFYLFLEGIVIIANVLMLIDAPEVQSAIVIVLAGFGFALWSLSLSQSLDTLIFILGLCGVSIGYVLKTGSLKREIALILGSALISLFSFLEASWIFFWLNVFFALLSLRLAVSISREQRVSIT